MLKNRVIPMFAAACVVAVVSACESSTDVSDLLPDASLEADATASAGDAIVVALATLGGNESGGNLLTADGGANLGSNSLTIVRTVKCLNSSDVEVVGCQPVANVRKIIAHVTLDGSRTGSNDAGTKTWTGAVHRVADDTMTRVFTGAVETSRVHVGRGAGNDTTTFTEGTFTRTVVETALDSVKSITWNLPRSSNPWPVSGSFVRRVNIKATATNGDRTQSREVNRRIEVVFPADAQGNVDLLINGRTCKLNLVTGAVTACT